MIWNWKALGPLSNLSDGWEVSLDINVTYSQTLLFLLNYINLYYILNNLINLYFNLINQMFWKKVHFLRDVKVLFDMCVKLVSWFIQSCCHCICCKVWPFKHTSHTVLCTPACYQQSPSFSDMIQLKSEERHTRPLTTAHIARVPTNPTSAWQKTSAGWEEGTEKGKKDQQL